MSKKKLIQIITALLIMLSIGKFLIWGINDLMTDIEVGDDLSSSKPFSALNYHLLDLDDDINYVILFDDIRNTSIIYDNEGNYLNTIDLLSEGRLEVVEISNNGEILFYQHKRYDQYILVNVNGTVLDIYEEDEPETKIALVKRIKNDNIDASTSNYIVFLTYSIGDETKVYNFGMISILIVVPLAFIINWRVSWGDIKEKINRRK